MPVLRHINSEDLSPWGARGERAAIDFLPDDDLKPLIKTLAPFLDWVNEEDVQEEPKLVVLEKAEVELYVAVIQRAPAWSCGVLAHLLVRLQGIARRTAHLHRAQGPLQAVPRP